MTRITPTAWQSWTASNFGLGANNALLAGFGSDPDRDGLANGLEYVLAGADPNRNSQPALPVASQSSGRLAISFSLDATRSVSSIVILASDSLSRPWEQAASSLLGAPFAANARYSASEIVAGQIRSIKVSDKFLSSDAAHPKRFMRAQGVQ